VGGDFLTVDWGETFHTRGERIFSPGGENILAGGREYSSRGERIFAPPGDILGGRKYHGTPAANFSGDREHTAD